MGGFGGNKVNPQDLLPFRQEVEDSTRTIPEHTIGVLVSLIESGRLPPRVVSAAQTNPHIKRALGMEG